MHFFIIIIIIIIGLMSINRNKVIEFPNIELWKLYM